LWFRIMVWFRGFHWKRKWKCNILKKKDMNEKKNTIWIYIYSDDEERKVTEDCWNDE
jgi:hypothetical protein